MILLLDYSKTKISERDFDDLKIKLEQGYKAYSPWFESMAKKLKFDRRKISQELECNFLGSGDNVIPAEIMKSIKDNEIREPENKFMGGVLWQWKEPIEWITNTLWVWTYREEIVRILRPLL
jgi:hypothetical protein